MSSQTVKGYKVTLPTSKSKHKKYLFEVGKSYHQPGSVKLCSNGFHFSIKPADCFGYYEFSPENLVFEIEATGEIVHGDDKSAASDIKIVRQISWQEVLSICNEGQDNTGLSNTGNRNTGYRNTGDSNTGNWNTGNWNTGYSNTGNRNTGDSNTGNWNTGYRNTGNRNTGYSNTGNRNTGNSNTGNWNTGNSNTGYSNTGNRNTGVFCTGEKYMRFFNKDSKWTEQKFLESRVYSLLGQVDTKMWVPDYAMTEEEKRLYPSYKTVEGYLKDIPFKEAFQNKWHNWSEENRQEFLSLPNFDAKIFKLITGVTVVKSKKK